MLNPDHPSTARPEVEIVRVESVDGIRLAVIVRCLATTRLGARLHHVDGHGRTVEFEVSEIHRYPGVPLGEVDPPHSARMILIGRAGEPHLSPGDLLRSP
ncbi:hypothetical protein GTW20_11855 [Nocardiopsis alba]|uniref:Uncharacterized protein n=1 Tax=Nocardiopsis alba TaxID=53437 RepID=A0A7K2ISJ2_9ACTN|nr:hypothetical protein [Nocardiopsis alba]MYR32942.1 hypothetical protein [Nocardiopsis alba]